MMYLRLGGLLLGLWGGSLLISPPKPYSLSNPEQFPEAPAPPRPLTAAGVELGRFLFYDPILSQDSSISCASCHRQEVAFSDAPATFSQGVAGRSGTRNSPGLFNLAWNTAQFWDGRAGSIESQIFFPLRSHEEMNLSWEAATRRINRHSRYPKMFAAAFPAESIDSTLISLAIGQFERSLISYRSKYDRAWLGEESLSQDEAAGFVIANEQHQGGCLACHPTDAYALGTTGGMGNNGLPVNHDLGLGGRSGDSSRNGWFKIPSLRNVALTAPYMHDGRFRTLEEVVQFYATGSHHQSSNDPRLGHFAPGQRLDSMQQIQLIAFLHTLTDSAFISDPRFGNPFQQLEE
ncbi:cytochrome c peroxidase [Pontibacter sp. G13]|uniref:cytochrome-c peroxidase n=1 Tax=Pontibacter sp. G13 TaxID=3074898 RepID=UPI0028894393|nr:cytochrome c peroxidase [Pontibacter sp. G13]WNJ17410.1 cytochrome c peroxidase [Pontibacter sp. G13]